MKLTYHQMVMLGLYNFIRKNKSFKCTGLEYFPVVYRKDNIRLDKKLYRLFITLKEESNRHPDYALIYDIIFDSDKDIPPSYFPPNRDYRNPNYNLLTIRFVAGQPMPVLSSKAYEKEIKHRKKVDKEHFYIFKNKFMSELEKILESS